MVPAATSDAERRLAVEVLRVLGEGPHTAEEVSSKLLAADAPVELLSAIEDALARAASDRETDTLDETLWGPEPSPEQLVAAQRAGHDAFIEALDRALEGALTREQVAQRLGVSPQAVSKRLSAGGLVALRRGRERRFPAWQFDDDGPLAHLPEVIAAWAGTTLSLSTWATSPSADLGGATPAQTLARGDEASVLAVERELTSDAW